jgi:glycerol-3-phosphate dehydrogenase
MLPQITRDPDAASRAGFDLIVVGGGIYGVMMLFEATRRKMKALLIEKEDFGSGTSFNWLRIIHGGLRYLQDADLPRFFESVAERSWFLKTFPSLVHPVPCLMPLYGKGLRRPSILRLAVLINDLLSLHRNQGLQEEKQIARGRILSRGETLKMAPGIRAEGLKGGVVWYDALLPESPILIKEILRWCAGHGAMALNYTAARSLVFRDDQVSGVVAEDLHLRKGFEFRSQAVVNAAGPWCRQVAAAFDRDLPKLFAYSKAWNVLFDRSAPAASVLAVAPDGPGARTYFLLPWKGRLMAGTGHAACSSPEERGRPTPQEMDLFISDINRSVPGLHLRETGVQRVFCGLLPAVSQGSDDLAKRSVILDHGRQGGPRGLFSVSGVKFTTVRRVAEKTMQRLFPNAPGPAAFDHQTMDEAIRLSLESSIFALNGGGGGTGSEIRTETLEQIMRSESAVHLHDLVFRRTNLWEDPRTAIEASALVGRKLGLERDRLEMEMGLLKGLLEGEKKR